MIILGIDPGSRKTGFGLIQKQGQNHHHIENGTLYLEDKVGFASRLKFLYDEICSLIKTFRPQVLAIENIFYHKNFKSSQKLGEIRGVCLLCGALTGLEIAEYTPLEVKKAITGYGNAGKGQMQSMVRSLLNLKDIAEENASDALAVALCAAQSHNKLTRAISSAANAVNPNKILLKAASFYR